MNMNPIKFLRPTRLGSYCFFLLLLPVTVAGLPEDKDQEVIVIASLGAEVSLDEGITIFRGTEAQPVVITQGSMEISGIEITIDAIDGDLSKISKITAIGKPARFHQQPNSDSAIIYAKGNNIVYDDARQLITIREYAELIQDRNTITGHLIEYEIESRKARAVSGSSDDRVKMSISPERIQ